MRSTRKLSITPAAASPVALLASAAAVKALVATGRPFAAGYPVVTRSPVLPGASMAFMRPVMIPAQLFIQRLVKSAP